MKLSKIEITPEQIIAVNQAIFLLQKSENNRAETVIYYLESLRIEMSKAKIIKGEQHAI